MLPLSASVPMLQVRLSPPAMVQSVSGFSAHTSPGGSASESRTSNASPGPSFVTVIVKRAVSPAEMVPFPIFSTRMLGARGNSAQAQSGRFT